MMKLLVLLVIIAVASADTWREGHRNPNCPVLNGELAFKIRGETCQDFYMCNNGWACKIEAFIEVTDQ